MHQESPLVSRRLLAQGLSGKIYATQIDFKNGKTVKAVVKKFSNHNRHHFEAECAAYKVLNPHPMFPEIFSINPQELEITMEYCRGGTLFDQLQRCGRFEEQHAFLYFKQILKGLRHMKRNGFSHRDVKLENIVLLRSDRFYVKMIDLSFSARPNSNNSSSEIALEKHPTNHRTFVDVIGTEGYQCPEMIRKEKYSGFEADMFSLGVLLFEMIHGKPPFFAADKEECEFYALFTTDKQQYWELFESLAPNKSPDLILLLEELLADNPDQRISLGKVFKNPWFIHMNEWERKASKELLRETALDFEKYKRLSMTYNKFNLVAFLSRLFQNPVMSKSQHKNQMKKNESQKQIQFHNSKGQQQQVGQLLNQERSQDSKKDSGQKNDKISIQSDQKQKQFHKDMVGDILKQGVLQFGEENDNHSIESIKVSYQIQKVEETPAERAGSGEMKLSNKKSQSQNSQKDEDEFDDGDDEDNDDNLVLFTEGNEDIPEMDDQLIKIQEEKDSSHSNIFQLIRRKISEHIFMRMSYVHIFNSPVDFQAIKNKYSKEWIIDLNIPYLNRILHNNNFIEIAGIKL